MAKAAARGRFRIAGKLSRALVRLPLFGLPVLRRELVASLRMPRAFWLLFAITGFSGAICLLAWTAQEGSSLSGSGLGYGVFASFAIVLLLLCLFLVPALASTAFASERDRGTFELLLAAPVRPVSIVVSKLVATTGYVLLVLISTTPLAFVLHTAGGIEFTEIGIGYLVILAYTAMGGCIGLSLSSRAPSVGKAAVRSLSLTFFYSLVLPTLGIVVTWLGLSAYASVTGTWVFFDSDAVLILCLLIPVTHFFQFADMASSLPFGLPPWAFPLAYAGAVSTGHLARVFLAMRRAEAVLTASKPRKKPRSRRPPVRSVLLLAGRLAGWGLEVPVFVKEVLTQPALERRRMLWQFVIPFVLASGGLLAPLFLYRDELMLSSTLVAIGLLLLATWTAFLLFRGAVSGAGAVAAERERGTLELLLVSPLSPGGFLRGKFLAALLGTVPSLLALWAAFAVAAVIARVTEPWPLRNSVPDASEGAPVFPLLACVTILALAWSFAWALGAFFSAGARGTGAALAWTLGTLFCLEVAVQFFGWSVFALLGLSDLDSSAVAVLGGLNPWVTLAMIIGDADLSALALLVYILAYGMGTALLAVLAAARLRAAQEI